MFCEVIKIKQGVSYRSFCPLRILYNSIIMATSSGTDAVVVTRVHCNLIISQPWSYRYNNDGDNWKITREIHKDNTSKWSVNNRPSTQKAVSFIIFQDYISKWKHLGG